MMQNDNKMIFDVRIGDMEGRYHKHAFYIVAEEDDIERTETIDFLTKETFVDYSLSDIGRKKFSHKWDTGYMNYNIDLVPKEEREKLIENHKRQIKQLRSKIISLLKDIDILI